MPRCVCGDARRRSALVNNNGQALCPLVPGSSSCSSFHWPRNPKGRPTAHTPRAIISQTQQPARQPVCRRSQPASAGAAAAAQAPSLAGRSPRPASCVLLPAPAAAPTRNPSSGFRPPGAATAPAGQAATDRSGAVSALDDGNPTPLPSLPEVLDQYGWMLDAPLEQLMAMAAALRDGGRHGARVTFSPKVFLPLTRLCRDTCGYCTFAQPPRPGRRAFMTLQEVLQVAALGASAGCSEALLTLGDKPEERWPEAASELEEMGYGSTLEYVEAAARAILRETGLLPHINAGVMGEEDLRRLKQVSASQGLMLESTSPDLILPGGPHHGCPDKHPAVRLATIEAAGRAAVPYTSGILVGIGDTHADRLHALACLHRLHDRFGHIQELIIQNFRAKLSTAMASAPEPPLEELMWAVAAARIMFGPDMNIQAPPNLTPLEAPAAAAAAAAAAAGGGDKVPSGPSLESLQAGWRALLDAGINDWGGISPITRDFVNPEKPWPHLAPLAAATAAAGKLLLPRLPVYPAFLGLRGDRRSGSRSGRVGDSDSRSHSHSDGDGDGDSPTATHTRLGPGPGPSPWGSVDAEAESVAAAATAFALSAGGGARLDDSSSGSGGGAEGPSSSSSAPSSSWSGGSWLDFGGGRDSVGAAVLRCADSEGLLRASAWVAGRPEPGTEGGGAEGGGGGGDGQGPQQPQPQQREPSSAPPAAKLSPQQPAVAGTAAAAAAAGSVAAAETAGRLPRASVPLPRWREGQAWRVAVGADGALEGVPRPTDPSPRVVRLLEGVLHGGRPLQRGEIELLLRSRGADHAAVLAAADELRRRTCGDTVSYVVNRNINYTNVCTYKCSFCAFSKGKAAEELRGPAYVVPYEEIARRTAEAWDRGATEVCMQGGIHPDFSGSTYLRILAAAKGAAPRLHVHAFSPLEVHHGATTLGLSYESYLERLAAAGLGSLPGTAAEVLHDDVRRVLCPDKIDTATWMKVVGAAHIVGLRTTSTLMFGSVEEGPAAWAAHLAELRELQQRAERGAAGGGGSGSGGVGITEFVPLPFVHMEAPVYLQGRARRGPTLHEGLLLHAVSRLALHPHIPNIQASWVKMGPSRAGQLLAAGCNDMGGSIMNETITRAAGASHGQELPPRRMEEIIRAAGRQPRQRTTLYGTPPAEQTARSYGAAPLQPLVMAAPGSGALR